jgi:putative DNA primase/helicase
MDDPLDAFAPLTEAELADAARQVPQDLEADAPKPACPPPDAENGVLAAARLYGRKPDSSWRYETADSETAYYVARWNEGDGKKVIRPLSWFDGESWKFGAWPNARPLYNLPAIAEQPNAPIIICEGEKAADAAARIFPMSIAATSSGGAGAAAKTDWSPLANRHVLIWPDNDAAGDKFAREVAATLAALDCSVSLIDAKALASIEPRGGAREPREKWDAADAIQEWPDLAALRKVAHG